MPVEQSVIGFGSPLSGDPLPPARNRVKIILTVGRVVERKGIAYLLRALPAIAAAIDAKIVIVGKGDPKVEADLHAVADALKLGDRVVFAGKLPEADLIRWYRDCDVFCLPAIVDSQGETEGLGVVLLEALNYARPVVASDVGGIPDIIKHGRTGLLCPEKDPAALAAAILQVLRDPDFGETLGRQGRAFVGKEFSWENIDSLWEAFYAQSAERTSVSR
jgi:glycosyltransferase involved in cell wall biosynthesis